MMGVGTCMVAQCMAVVPVRGWDTVYGGSMAPAWCPTCENNTSPQSVYNNLLQFTNSVVGNCFYHPNNIFGKVMFSVVSVNQLHYIMR